MEKYSKEYKKMMKKHKKLIMSSAKRAANNPEHYLYGLFMLVRHLEFMKEYYALGEGITSEEPKERIKRERILNMILAAYEDWITQAPVKNEENKKRFFELLGEYIDQLWNY